MKFPRVMMMVLMIVTNDDDFVLFSVFLYSNENPHIRTYAHQKKSNNTTLISFNFKNDTLDTIHSVFSISIFFGLEFSCDDFQIFGITLNSTD